MRAQHSAMLADCAEGERVTVCGWLGNQRRLGGLLFGKLRDSYGSVQVVVDGASAQGALDLISGLGQESVVRVEGTLRQRPAGQANPDAFNGTLEVVITGDDDVQVLNAAAALPITVGETTDESLRLQHRHIDLRRPEMQRNLRLRSAVSRAVREYLCDVSSRGGRVGVCRCLCACLCGCGKCVGVCGWWVGAVGGWVRWVGWMLGVSGSRIGLEWWLFSCVHGISW